MYCSYYTSQKMLSKKLLRIGQRFREKKFGGFLTAELKFWWQLMHQNIRLVITMNTTPNLLMKEVAAYNNLRTIHSVYCLPTLFFRIMGQTLSEPVTTKESSCCQNSKLKVGSSCMQGWRITMEDAHTQILSIPDDPGTAFFGVYDGHGGARIAQYAGVNLHNCIVRRPEYKNGNIKEALVQGFLDIDNDMLKDENLRDELAGSTAIVILIKDNTLFCANVGDSRAVACVSGKVEPLSEDHKPNNELENKRIVAAGGYVECNRVNGNLALSRALGDFNFKKNDKKTAGEQMVTAYPDVEVRTITQDWEFVVMACDGIWDVMTNEEVVEFVRVRVSTGMEPEDICQDLMTTCLAPDCQMGGLGCDNMTVVIICFLHGQPYMHLQTRCSQSPHILGDRN